MKRQNENFLLSIVIPVHNRQVELNRLIKILLTSINDSDKRRNIELIIVDDNSSEPIIIDKEPDNYTLIKNSENKGAPYSREKGLNHATGKFIHFHDSDDFISESWLDEIINEIQLNPDLDLLITGRTDVESSREIFCYQKYFHEHVKYLEKIQSRLIYRNCLGPLGGVTFSRRVLEQIEFKRFASCQDWQMYLEAIKHARVLISRPDIKFIFNKTGDDRISHNPRKKILGHLQLAKITNKQSVFDRNIRLFYLYTCKQHIYNKGGAILRFYKKNRIKIFVTFLMVSLYWRLT